MKSAQADDLGEGVADGGEEASPPARSGDWDEKAFDHRGRGASWVGELGAEATASAVYPAELSRQSWKRAVEAGAASRKAQRRENRRKSAVSLVAVATWFEDFAGK